MLKIVSEHNELDESQFEILLWDFGLLIEGFKHYRPILCNDVTDLYGKYVECYLFP